MFFFLLTGRPPVSTLFPYTTLFRSCPEPLLAQLGGDPDLDAEPCRDDRRGLPGAHEVAREDRARLDRKSTRLNSSHANILYAVFCLKKKITVIFAVRAVPSTTLCFL